MKSCMECPECEKERTWNGAKLKGIFELIKLNDRIHRIQWIRKFRFCEIEKRKRKGRAKSQSGKMWQIS